MTVRRGKLEPTVEEIADAIVDAHVSGLSDDMSALFGDITPIESPFDEHDMKDALRRERDYKNRDMEDYQIEVDMAWFLGIALGRRLGGAR